ncbi:MAG: DMT family transporter, partial [Clostridia bacterium]
LLLGGLGFAVYHTSLNYGEQTVSAGVASLVVSTAPIFSALLALLFYRERFGTRGWIGSVIGLAGVLLVSFGTDAGLTLTSGAWLILLAALAESFYFVFQKSYLEKYGFLAFTTYTIWAGTLWMLFFLPGLVQEMIAAPVEATLSVLYLGLFPTVLPYFALAYITSRVGASEATSSLYLTPVLAFVIAWFWLGEVPTVLAIVGGGVTLAGVLLANSSSTATEKAQESGI